MCAYIYVYIYGLIYIYIYISVTSQVWTCPHQYFLQRFFFMCLNIQYIVNVCIHRQTQLTTLPTSGWR